MNSCMSGTTRSRTGFADKMNATEYMAHWRGWRVWRRLALPVHQARFRCLGALVEGETAIDVGCALGHSTAYLAQHRPVTWAGMDFDEAAVIEARQLFPDHEFIYSPDYDMMSATGGRTFETVVCSEVIEHVADEAAFVDGLFRLATRRVIVTTPAVRINDPGHLRLYTPETLRGLFPGLSPRIERVDRFYFVTIDVGGRT